ncbi:MAG: hypothetical protein U0M42_04860 [Acutalibacteraceae bacterium]|nr:hypothetical protein [Acutalibacteraceae bacterium]
MDWGAAIVFILSIIGAVILSGGDVLFGIIAFLLIFCILAAIKGVIKYLVFDNTKNSEPEISSSANSNVKIVLDEQHFVLVHDQVIKFLRTYSSALPYEWYHYFISQTFEHAGGTTEGFLEFKILLGNWWDSLLYNSPDIKDYMMSVFSFDASENTFTYRIRTGICSGGSYPQDKITKMIHTYLNEYEATHNCIHLTKDSFGAKYSNI